MCIRRGNLIGTFTWRNSDAGKHVVMPTEHWKYTVSTLLSWQYVLHRMKLELDGEVTKQNVHNVRTLIDDAIRVQADENGPVDRRG